MGIKKIGQSFLCCLTLLILSNAKAQIEFDQNTQIININTALNNLVGSPSWLLIVRDLKTGRVLPYLYEIKNNDNFWIAFTGGRSYRITVSSLKFGPYAKINNFCNLENGTINAESYSIRITGELSPNPHTSKCFVSKYKNNLPFTITAPTPSLEDGNTSVIINPATGGAIVQIGSSGVSAVSPAAAPPAAAGGGGSPKPPAPAPDEPLPYVPIDMNPSGQGLLLSSQPGKPIITGNVK